MLNKIFKTFVVGAVATLVVACGPTKQEAPIAQPAPKPVPPKPQPPKPAPKESVSKIGFVVPLSGPHAEIGGILPCELLRL